MADPKIDSNDAFLLFADLQAGIADLPLTVGYSQLQKGVRGLARLARILEIPFLVTAVRETPEESRILPEIGEELGEFELHYRTTADSYENAVIRQTIEDSGRKTILISGVATEVAVQLPTLSFASAGFRTFIVVEACGGISHRTEEAVFRRVEQAGGSTTSVLTLAGELAGDFSTAKAQEAVKVLFMMAAP